LLVCSLTSLNLCAQTPIEPTWKTTFGSHDHTSRDELTQAKRDSEGNVIVVGLVERDSTFGDIMVQKLNPSGTVIWQYRYSSEYSINYDRPIGLLIGRDNSIHILGIVSNNTDVFGGGGYAFKLNKNGGLIWERKLFAELPWHVSVSSLFWDMDKNETLHIAYTADAFTSKPTYFFRITADNVALPMQTVPDIFHARTEQPVPKNMSVSPSGAKTYLIEQPTGTGSYTYYTHRITDTTNVVAPIDLGTQPANWQGLVFDLRTRDAEGNFYVLGNRTLSNRREFKLHKILANGQIGYNMFSTDSVDIEAKDMFVRDSSLIVTGRFRLLGGSWRVFVYEIDKTGRVTKKNFMPQGVGDELAEGIYPSNGKLFLTINKSNGAFTASELDSNFNRKWEYVFKRPTGPAYEHYNIVSLNDTTVLFSGTLKSRKSPTNYFVSENDFYLQSFNPKDVARQPWQYRFSDIGTSKVLGIRAVANKRGDVLATYSEQVGPSYPATGSSFPVGVKSYFSVINPSGQVVSNNLTTAAPFSFKNFFTDADGNFVMVGTQIQKVDKNGNVLASLNSVGTDPNLLFVDTLRNQFYVGISSTPYTVLKFDKNFNIVGSIYPLGGNAPSGVSMKFFQLKGDSTTYYYNVNFTNTASSTIALYGNERLYWQKDTLSSFFDTFTPYDVSPKDGSFVLCLGNILTKFALANGQMTSKAVATQSGDYVRQVFCMFDGNVIVTGSAAGDDLILASNESLDFVRRTVLTHEFHINYFRLGQFLVRTTDGLILFLTSGNRRAGFYQNDLMFNVKEENFDDNYNCTVGARIGNSFPLGSGSANEAAGWNWSRGTVARFGFRSKVEAYLTSISAPKTAVEDMKITAYPNPIGQNQQLKLFIANDLDRNESYDIKVYNALGQIVLKTIWTDKYQDPTLDFSGIKSGLYFIKVSTNNQSKSSALVKIVKEN
jgi:hypothetical protein